MKILAIAPTPFFADRGCHMRILGEIEALKRRGHEFLLLTYHLGRDIDGVATKRTKKGQLVQQAGGRPGPWASSIWTFCSGGRS
jgi:hypothetical protein